MPLPKQGNKIYFQQLWQCHCRKWGKKSGSEIWGRVKKKSVLSTIFLQHFHNKSHVISYYQLKKKICDKLIVAIALPKQVKFFFGNCGNVIAENGRKKKLWLPKSGEEFKKNWCYIHNIFTIFSQQITGDQLLLVQIWI